MADFDLEQLKTLFENLADRLDQTDGDNDTLAELQKMRAMVTLMAKQMATEAKSGGHRRENKEWLDQFWQTWKTQNPLGPLKQAQKTGKAPKGTIIRDLQNKQRGSANPFDMFQKQTDSAGKQFTSSLRGFHDSLVNGVQTMGSFFDRVKKDGVLAAAGGGTFLAMLGHAINSQADSLRALKSAGDGSISSWSQMNHVANDANMSVEEMAKNFELAGQAGKRMGALQFTGLSIALTKATAASGQMAMSLEDRTKAQSDYLDMLAQRADGTTLSTDQMAEGIKRLVKSSEQTASILGLNRDDAIKLKKEQGRDTIMTDLVRRMGLNSDSVTSVQGMVEKTMGETSRKLLNYAIAGKAPQGDAAQLAGVDGKQYELMQKIAALVKQTKEGGPGVDQVQIAQMIKQYGVDAQQSGLGKNLDMIGLGGDGQYAGVIASRQGGVANAAALDPKAVANPADDPATKALLQLNAAETAFANLKNTLFTAVFDPLMKDKDFFPSLLADFKGLTRFLAGFVKEMAAHPTIMKNLAKGMLGLGAVIATLGLAFGALKVVLTPFIMLFKTGKTIKSILGGGGGAAEEAAGGGLLAKMFGKKAVTKVASRRGLSILGQSAVEGEAAEGGAAIAGGGALAAGALLLGGAAVAGGGAYLAGRQMDKRRNESLLGMGKGEKGFWGSRASAYGTAAASGAAGGAAIGAVFGGIGAIPGALIGGAIGTGYAGYRDLTSGGSSSKPALAGKKPVNDNDPQTQMEKIRQQYLKDTGVATQTSQIASKLAMSTPTTGVVPVHADLARGPKQMTMDEMTNKVMDASERAATHLKAIRDNSDAQLNLMREDVSLSRSHAEKVQRLLEEANRNSKRIADRTT